jgi:ABC-type lipoprotein release transport system permease subunit
MTLARLLLRNLLYYWPTNAAVVLGVAVAVSVLAGSLVVGDSVQESLRRLALERLGSVDTVVFGRPFLREGLASDLAGDSSIAFPLLVLEGVVGRAKGGERANRVDVYGIDARFGRLQDPAAPSDGFAGRDAFASPALASELNARAGDTLVLTLQQPTAIPAGVLQGRRDGNARTVRLTLRDSSARPRLREFALRPSQGAVRALFVPLALLQRTLAIGDRVNAIALASGELFHPRTDPSRGDQTATGRHGVDAALSSTQLARRLREVFALDDVGLKVRIMEQPPTVVVESESGFVSEPLRETLEAMTSSGAIDARPVPVLTYLANSIRVGDREIPYSVVAAVDLTRYAGIASLSPPSRSTGTIGSGRPPIGLNEWAVSDLRPGPGADVRLDYFVWSDDDGLTTRSAEFEFAGSVPMAGAGRDRTLTPDYPGLTDQVQMSDWDPPFPVDLGRVRAEDEAYWTRYGAAPKAFVSLEEGQRLWSSPYGRITSMRLVARGGADLAAMEAGVRSALREAIDPVGIGAISIVPVRAEALRAAAGTTDFGQYFVYFSLFLVVSGLLLAGLFFRLGVEQRLREIGLLRAVGVPERNIRLIFIAEGTALALAGALVGIAGALGYASLVMHGLRTWWSDAVGTTSLLLEPRPLTLFIGAVAGAIAAPVVVALTLRRLVTASPRALISGATGATTVAVPGTRGASLILPAVIVLAGLSVPALAAAGLFDPVPAFFTGGAMLLLASLGALRAWLRAPVRTAIAGAGWWPVARLGARGAAYRPGRTVLSVALIAFATFTIVAVGAFRREAPARTDRMSGTGGYALIAESVLPIHHDFGNREGRTRLGFTAEGSTLAGIDVARFRLRPGDDASCLNLYRPTNPRILGAPLRFLEQGRFAFAASLGATSEERRNPWMLLTRRLDDGAVPAIGDLNSLTYAFHLSVGDDFVLERPGATPVRLRIVAALADSVLQSELIVGEEDFIALFPRQEGFRTFLVDTGTRPPDTVARTLETELTDYGLDVTPAAERLATFHRVENTYLTTFQTLGGLGLILGTVGVGVVLFRNVIERRRELAVLRAVGYGNPQITLLVLAESAIPVVFGAAFGTICAMIAIAPALSGRAGRLPLGWLAALLTAIVVTGLLSSIAAAAAARRFALVPVLRSE